MHNFSANRYIMHLFFPSLISILLFSSCEEILSVKVSEHAPMMTLNCIMYESEAIKMEINSSQPYPPFADTSLTIKNATAKLFEDDIYVEDLVYYEYYQIQKNISNYHSLSGFTPQLNHTYSINVTAPGYTEVTAKTSIPNPVPVISIDTNTVYTKNGKYTIKALECTIKFKDPQGKKNYYKLGINRLGRYTECDYQGRNCITHVVKKSEYFLCNDLNTVFFKKNPNTPGSVSLEKDNNEQYIKEIFIADNSFDGLTYELKVLIPLPLEDMEIIPGGFKGQFISKIFFNLYSINEEYFRYARSYFTQVYNKNDMFSEPSLVYSNIEKGLGIFSGTSLSADSSVVMPVHYTVMYK